MRNTSGCGLKDSLLTETFISKVGDVNAAYEEKLTSLIESANNNLSFGKLVVSDGKKCTLAIHSKADIYTDDAFVGKEQQELEDSIVRVAMYMQLVARGTAMSLTDETGKDKLGITSFISTVVNRTLANSQGISLLPREINAHEVIADVTHHMQKLEYDTNTKSGRVDLISHVLDRKYCNDICNKALQKSIKQMDSEALRIALQLDMTII